MSDNRNILTFPLRRPTLDERDVSTLIMRFSMDSMSFLVGLSCFCLIVGIYFFFVRHRETEQQPQDTQ